MNNRDTILATIQSIMVEMFEIDAKTVTPEARLYEDLDFDSIDAIDMIVRLKEMTGKAVKPEDFKAVRTVADIVDVVEPMFKD